MTSHTPLSTQRAVSAALAVPSAIHPSLYNDNMSDHSQDPHEWNNLINDPQMEAVIKEHASFIPSKQHPILPGKSTGHNAYAASNAEINK